MDPKFSQHLQNRRVRLLVLLSVLVGFLLTIFLRDSFASIDRSGNYWAITIQNTAFTDVAVIISVVFDPNVLLALSLALSILFFRKNYRKCSLILLAGMVGTAISLLVSKMLVLSPRPPNGLITETGYSFPSGHITSGIVFFGLIAYFAWHIWNSSKTRRVSIMLSLITIALVGFDRIYLNVHWVSDVLGGFLLGTFWLLFSILVLTYWENERNCKFSNNTLTKEKEPLGPIN
jgi:membrane-associated phospholipid phosphatase